MLCPPVNIVNELKNFMLSEERIDHYLSYSIHNNINNKIKDTTKPTSSLLKSIKPKNTFFIPKQKDTLFWCFYIIVNGIDKYENLHFINIVVEKSMKIEYVEKLRKNKDLLKTNKCAPLLHIENMLVNEYKIDIKTFLALCLVEHKNIFFIKKRIFYELEVNSLEKKNIIHYFAEKNNFGLELDNFTVEEYKKDLYQVSHLDKPIKAISAYNSEELIEIAKKLGIDCMNASTGKNMLKKNIYELIVQYLS